MADDAQLRQTLDAIGELVVKRADSYQVSHSQLKERAVEIYYSFIGRFRDGEGPEEAWQSHLYPKMMKPKIVAVWSQFVQAATSSKEKWQVEPRGINTPASSGGAKRMKNRIMEQAQACELDRTLKSGALDMFLYGTEFIQAPIVETKRQQQWVIDMGGDDIKAGNLRAGIGKALLAAKGQPIWKAQFNPQDTPSVVHRNYFEMFPWPYSGDIQAGEAVIHRPFMDKYEMANLRDQPGYYKDVIEEILKTEPGAPPSWSKEAEMMNARGWMSDSKRRGYDLCFMAGKLDAKDLNLGSVQGFEGVAGRYVEVLAWVVNHTTGKRVIKLIPNPVTGKFRPFLMSHYEQMPYESMGVGVGENSVDIAKAIGGALRLFMDGKKMALPMMGINTSYFSGSTEIEFAPFRIFPFDEKSVKPKDAMFPIQFADVTQGMVEFIEILERIHDEITGVPKWTTGVDSKMLNKTATGISMIMNASSQLIRGAIENMDDYIITPIGQRFYDWNMKQQGKEYQDLKGDFIVTAAGLSTLMQKETLNQQLLGILSMVINPMVMQSPFALRLLRQVADNMGEKDVDSILPDPDQMTAFANQDPRAAAAGLNPSAPPPGMMPHGGRPAPAPPDPRAVIESAKLEGVASGMRDKMHDMVAGSGEAGPGNGGAA